MTGGSAASPPKSGDLATLGRILDRAGVVFEVRPAPGDAGGEWWMTVEEGMGPQNFGYGCFFSRLVFDGEGALVEWGCWE